MKSKNSYDNEALIAKIKSGDEAVMEYVYREYYPMVAHFVRNNNGNGSDAEDLYQEGLVIVFRRIRAGEHIQYLKSYVYSVCRLKWLERLRYNKRHPEKLVENYDFVEVTLDEEEDAELHHQAIQGALNELNEVCRQLLMAFYFEKKSMHEIADHLGYNEANTAKSKKNKCMDRMRNKAKTILRSLQNKKL